MLESTRFNGIKPFSALNDEDFKEVSSISPLNNSDLESHTKLFLTEAVSVDSDEFRNISSFITQAVPSQQVSKFTLSLGEFNAGFAAEIAKLLPSNVKFGIAQPDAASNRLEQLLNSGVKVSVAQIDADACCALPPDLLELSQKHDLDLVVNHDPQPLYNVARTISLYAKRQVVYSTIYHKL